MAEEKQTTLSPDDIAKIIWSNFNAVCADDGNIYAQHKTKPENIFDVRSDEFREQVEQLLLSFQR